MRGFTNNKDKWNWKNFTCDNISTCWGKEKRFLEIQHLNHQWMLNFYNILNVAGGNGYKMQSKKNIEKLYIRYYWFSHNCI